jgi:hypothetical protein
MATLSTGVVDYAGLFPPAALSLPDAIAEYARACRSPDQASLGRFVIGARDLDDFATATAAAGASGWRLSVLLGDDVATDHALIDRFNSTQVAAGQHVAEAVELRATNALEAACRLALLPSALVRFVEVPLGADLPPLLAAIKAAGAGAKVRLGGVTAGAFPTTGDVICFLRACHAAHVPFKATAGLHHALRGEYPLTYAPDSPRGTMFGWVSLLLATALVRRGATAIEITALLEERATTAIAVGDAAIVWHDHEIDAAALADVRHHGMQSFGSCSFREPVTELHELAAR